MQAGRFVTYTVKFKRRRWAFAVESDRLILSEESAMTATSEKTVLYMLRHGEPDPAYHDRLSGQIDVPLPERGKRQSDAVAERLASIPFDVVYSSDLARAVYLAQALADRHNLPVRQLELFRERHMGKVQGLRMDEIRAEHPEIFLQYQTDRAGMKVEGGGESYEDLKQRVVPAIEELIQTYPNHRIALAAHAGPIRVMLGHVLDIGAVLGAGAVELRVQLIDGLV